MEKPPPQTVQPPEPNPVALELSIDSPDLSKQFQSKLRTLDMQIQEAHWHEAIDSIVGLVDQIRVSGDPECTLQAAVGLRVVRLLSLDVDQDTRSQLVYATEVIQFPEGNDERKECRRQVIQLLRKEAQRLRKTNDPQEQGVLRAAIRRYASMIPEADVGTLVEFLEPSLPIETRHVATRGIYLVFSDAPPSPSMKERGQATLQVLKQRLVQLVSPYLTPEDLIPGVATAVVVDGILTLAVLGDREESLLAAAKLVKLDRPVLAEILLNDLEETLTTWRTRREGRPAASDNDPSVGLLEDLSKLLRQPALSCA